MTLPNTQVWEPLPFRMFISHAFQQANLAKNIRHELKKYSISTFVAQESIPTTESWLQWIEYALTSTNYVVVLVTPESNESPWVNQEVGFAYARRIPIIGIKIGADPKGFVNPSQAKDCADKDSAHIASEIFNTILRAQPLFEIAWSILTNLYIYNPDASQAKHICDILKQLESITPEQELKLVTAINSSQHRYNSPEFISTTTTELKRLTDNTYTVYNHFNHAQLIRFESTNPVWGYTGQTCTRPGTYYSQCTPDIPMFVRAGQSFPLCGNPDRQHLYHAAYWFLREHS